LGKLTKNNVMTASKVVVMLLLLFYIGNQVHWQDYQVVGTPGSTSSRPGLVSCLAGVHLLPFVLAIGFQFLALLFTAYRWRLLMMVQGISLSRNSVLRLSFLGEFFNNFLPGAIGGDAIKAYYVMRHTGKKGSTVVSIIASRFSGLLTMVEISAVILTGWLFFAGDKAVALKRPVFLVFFLAGVLGVILFAVLNEKINNSRLLRILIQNLPFNRQLEVIRDSMYRYRTMGRILGPVLFYSVLIVLSFILSVMFAGISLEIEIAWYAYFIYLPLIMIMSAVPVTPGGIGVMEELFLYFFSSTGDPQKILLMALLYRFSVVFCSLPGGLILLSSDKISSMDLFESNNDDKISEQSAAKL